MRLTDMHNREKKKNVTERNGGTAETTQWTNTEGVKRRRIK